MTVTLIFLLVIFILALLFLPFMRQIAKDKIELSQTTLPKKFEILFAAINAGLMEGKGELTTFDDDAYDGVQLLLALKFAVDSVSKTVDVSNASVTAWFR